MSFHAEPTFPITRTRSSLQLSIALALLAIALISCARKESVPEGESTTSTTTTTSGVQISRIELGKELTSDRRVITWSTSFTPADTVYAAVFLTAPVPATQVTARWTAADGQVVHESTQMVTPSDTEAVTQFHMIKPAGLPPGSYKLEVLVDGQVVSTKDFIITAL